MKIFSKIKEATNTEISLWFSIDLILVVFVILSANLLNYFQLNGSIPIKGMIDQIENTVGNNLNVVFASDDGYWLKAGSEAPQKILNYGDRLTLSQDKSSVYFIADGSIEELNLSTKALSTVIEKQNDQYITGFIFYSYNELIYWTGEDLANHSFHHKFLDSTNDKIITLGTSEILTPAYWRADNKIILTGYQDGFPKLWLYDLSANQILSSTDSFFNGWDNNFIAESHGLYYLDPDPHSIDTELPCEAHKNLSIKSIDTNKVVLKLNGNGQMINILGFSPNIDQVLVSFFDVNQNAPAESCGNQTNVRYFIYDLNGQKQESTDVDMLLKKWNDGYVGATINSQDHIQYHGKVIEDADTYKILMQYF